MREFAGNYQTQRHSKRFRASLIFPCLEITINRCITSMLNMILYLMVFLGKGGKTDKQDSKESKSTDDKGKTGKAAAEQEEKPPPLPSAYDEDLKLRAAMYGVLFQAYADKVSHCPC